MSTQTTRPASSTCDHCGAQVARERLGEAPTAEEAPPRILRVEPLIARAGGLIDDPTRTGVADPAMMASAGIECGECKTIFQFGRGKRWAFGKQTCRRPMRITIGYGEYGDIEVDAEEVWTEFCITQGVIYH